MSAVVSAVAEGSSTKAGAVSTAAPDLPLCVDLDGTLLRTDLLHESVLLLVKQSPASLLRLPFWLLRGKAYMKQRIAERVRFDWTHLPRDRAVVALVAEARAAGRETVLATASPRSWAEAVAAETGVFDAVVATEGTDNLDGPRKADRLEKLYGTRGFDYVGNAEVDLEVWRRARAGIVVSSSERLARRAADVTEVKRVIAPASAGPKLYAKQLRAHQWLKNLLIFVPIAAAHRLTVGSDVMLSLAAFAAFSLCASTVYILNDLLDLDADRQHVRKRARPVAAGRIAVASALACVPVLLVAAAALCLWLPARFALVIGVYFVLTLAYSLRLKRQVIVDLMMLAVLYTIRVVAGSAATAIAPSFWLLSFSMFMFFSLAVVKRYAEMQLTLAEGKEVAAGRGYRVSDLGLLLALGVASGMAAVMVLALYVNDEGTRHLYAASSWLWGVPLLILYWISRTWMKAQRGEMHDDPVVFAVRDWQSLATVAAAGACFLLAR